MFQPYPHIKEPNNFAINSLIDMPELRALTRVTRIAPAVLTDARQLLVELNEQQRKESREQIAGFLRRQLTGA